MLARLHVLGILHVKALAQRTQLGIGNSAREGSGLNFGLRAWVSSARSCIKKEKIMIIHDMEQGSWEWLNIKLGKFGASKFHKLMSELSKDKSGQMSYLLDIVSERLNLVPADTYNPSNKDIERGILYEPYARQAYEQKMGISVQQVGFVELNATTGCSPDGLISFNGILEIKSPNSHNFLNGVISQYIKPEYKTQMQFCLYVTDREWCDYVIYNVQFTPSIFIQRIYRDEEVIQKIKFKLAECNSRIENLISNYLAVIETKGEKNDRPTN